MSHRLQVTGVALLSALVATLVVFAVAPQSSTSAGLPAVTPTTTEIVEVQQPSALFVGDSFAAGTGAGSKDETHACLTAAAMGWICNVDAQPGTGFVANGHANDDTYSPLIDRLPDTKAAYLADIVIVDAGRNDRHVPDSQLKDAITTYLNGLRTAWPDARLVVIEPYFLNNPKPILTPAVRAHLHAEAKRVGGNAIDPFASGWILPDSGTKDLDVQTHPQIAQRLEQAVRALGHDDLQITDRRLDIS